MDQELLDELDDRRNREHIRLIRILHRVAGWLYLAGSLVFLFQYFMMRSAFQDLDGVSSGVNGGTPFSLMFDLMFIIGFLVALALSLLCFVSATKMRDKEGRMFSIVVGCVNCLYVPLGTALGIFTLFVLTKESVITRYYREES
ncbi:MAG: hypothetical protein AAF226_01300 [Verrucomicrobiota bacterium]